MIQLKLKRKLQYKSSALSLNVRQHKVIQVAWLASNSALYQQEGITVNQAWSGSLNDQDDSTNAVPDYNSDDRAITENVDNLDNDDFSEEEAKIPAGVTDTMLTATDFLDNSDPQQIHNVAPGEGRRPLSIFQDQYSEELAYPGIFSGQKRPDDKQLLTSVLLQ